MILAHLTYTKQRKNSTHRNAQGEFNHVCRDGENPSFISELELLIARYSYLGIGADIASMSVIELRGLYCYLLRLAKA